MQFNRRQAMAALAMTSLGGRAAFGADADQADAKTADCSGRIRLSCGHQIGYSCYGPPTGKPVLYFHGTPSSRIEAEIFADVCCAKDVFLVAVDRPGMGLSSYQADHTVANWPRDVEKVIQFFERRIGSKTWGVMSMSGGTPFGLACAQYLPQYIDRLALLSPRTPGAPGVPWGVVDRGVYLVRRRPRLAKAALKAQIRRLRKRPQRARSRQLDRFHDVDQRFVHRNSDWFRRTVLEAARCGTTGIVRDISLMPWPWNISLSAIQIPLAVYYGQLDYSAPPATTDFLKKQHNGCNVNVNLLPDDGHFTVLETASGCALDWLNGEAC